MITGTTLENFGKLKKELFLKKLRIADDFFLCFGRLSNLNILSNSS